MGVGVITGKSAGVTHRWVQSFSWKIAWTYETWINQLDPENKNYNPNNGYQ